MVTSYNISRQPPSNIVATNMSSDLEEAMQQPATLSPNDSDVKIEQHHKNNDDIHNLNISSIISNTKNINQLLNENISTESDSNSKDDTTSSNSEIPTLRNEDDVLNAIGTLTDLSNSTQSLNYDQKALTFNPHAKCNYISSNESWTHEEDMIIIRERKNRLRGWAPEALKHLKGRSLQAVHSRWKRTLRFRGPDGEKLTEDSPIKIGHWTEEEDNILAREFEKDPKRWLVGVMKQIKNRTRDAIRGRWRDIVIYKNIGAAQVTSVAPWTDAEDITILREYHRNPKNYLSRCVLALPDRTVRAIRARWNTSLKSRYEALDGPHPNDAIGIELQAIAVEAELAKVKAAQEAAAQEEEITVESEVLQFDE